MFTEQELAFLRTRRDEAEAGILAAVRRSPAFPWPYLPAGANYNGIWLEHNQDNFFITDICPGAAWGSMEVFMCFQREDGLMPAFVRGNTLETAGFGQLQTVWPFARCAMEIARRVGRPEEDFRRIYDAAVRYDMWIMRHRCHNDAGLVEMFCEFDTGHDNSPRVTEGMQRGRCPGSEAGSMPDLPEMPVISADLSAARYGALTALAELAEMLDLGPEAVSWRNRAETLRENIRRHLFCEEDAYFYDRGRSGFRKYRSEHITRLFLNRVASQDLFDRIYQRYFESETEFLTVYPFPSMSVSDPAFQRELPFNCWAANTQMLTLLRLLLFMDFYHRSAELDMVLERFLRAVILHPENHFSQEINPFSGAPVGASSAYLPGMILVRESCRRLKLSGA